MSHKPSYVHAKRLNAARSWFDLGAIPVRLQRMQRARNALNAWGYINSVQEIKYHCAGLVTCPVEQVDSGIR